MLKMFTPTYTVKHFSDISIEKLLDKNIKLVLCDIDNTLVAPDDPYLSDDAKEFIKALLAADIDVALISNNTSERVSIFNEPLKLNTYPMALKPLSKTYNKVKADYSQFKNDEIISIGDQVLTDVLGSNFAKIQVILVNQIVKKDLMVTKLNRLFENIIVKILKKRKKWPNEGM